MSANRRVIRSMRRHAKLNHASVGGASHTGRAHWKVRKDNRKDDRPEPMKVPLSEYSEILNGEGL